MKEGRVKRILEAMKANDIPQMLVSSPASIFYLTGKWISPGERMITLYLNTKGEQKFIVNELFPINEDLGVDILWYNDTMNPIDILDKIIDHKEVLGIDKDWKAHFLIQLLDRNSAKKFVNGSPIVDRVRMRKDDEEIALMKEASRINDIVVEKAIKSLKEGMTEKEVVEVLGKGYAEYGCQGYSFEPIVAFAANAADPHAESGEQKLEKGMGVLIDTGCRKDYYCSDMTRCIFFGEPTEHQKEIFNTVLEANKKAIDMIKPGVRFCDIDKAAREVIENKGYGKYFTHRTGHSIGIETHDFGDVGSTNTDEVKPGMIFSVEPGIYLQGDMGVRIEDLVLVTEDGCERLNHLNKELVVIK